MPPLKIILIRQAHTFQSKGEQNNRLTTYGVQETERVAKVLKELRVFPEVFVLGLPDPCRETTQVLADHLECHQDIVRVESVALTPGDLHVPDDSVNRLGNIVASAAERGVDLDSFDTVAFVGDDPNLSQIVVSLTGTRIRAFDHLDVVCVAGNDLRQLRLGSGKLSWRIPVRAYEETELRTKIASKVSVATFLAGFTFTALIQVLSSKDLQVTLGKVFTDPLDSLEWLRVSLSLAATLCLTASVGLFVAAVYIYDALTMPAGFRLHEKRTEWRRLSEFVQKHQDFDGPVYAHMIDAWQRVFTPAVALAAIGFLLNVVGQTSYFSIVYVGVLVAVWRYYHKQRPQLGVD